MMQSNTPAADGHTLTLTNRNRAVITGVEDVDCFNEQIVILRTVQGDLTLAGENLNIAHLNLEDGRLVVEGEVISLEYVQRAKGSGRSLLGRIFR